MMLKWAFPSTNILPWILLGTALCRGIQGCGPVKADIVLLIDESGSVGRRNFPKQLDFCNTLIDSLNIGADDVRIGAVTFSDDPVFHFALDTYTTSSDVKTAISNIDYKRGGTDIAKGIDYVKDTFLTAANGDRSGVTDYILLITDGTSSGAATAGQTAIASGITIWVVGIGYEVEPYQQELIDIVTPQDDYFFFASDFDDLANIAPQVAAVLPCPYFCGEWAIAYASPASLSQYMDANTGEMYLLKDAVYDINCCAVISGWEFYANTSGDITMLVWRNRGSAYELMGSNTITVTASDVGKVKNYTVPLGQRIGVVAGDRLGWYCSGSDIIPYDYCNTTLNENCPQSTVSTTPGGGLPVVGSMFDWDALSGTADRGYAIQAYTTNNSELTLTDVVYNWSLPDSSPVGYTFMTFNLTDIDVEEITYNFTHSYLSVNETSMEIILTTALPRDNSLGSSTLTLVAYDTCQHTVSVTFSVSIFNEEPSINNLPATLSLPESTPNSTRLFELDTSDLSGDPVCCVLSEVIPRSDNFVLEYDNVTDKYSVYTSTTAQFGYWICTSYQLSICCDDGHIYTKKTLTFKIPKPSRRSVPPGWIYIAIGLSMLPITICFGIAGVILILTFLLEDYAT